MSKEFNYRGYDLLPAILARCMLLHNTYPMATLIEKVFTPTNKALQDLTRQQPSHLTILHSVPYSLPDTHGHRVNVDIVLPNKQVFHLGTVVDATHALHVYRQALAEAVRLRDQKRFAALLKQGPYTIRREWHQCLIPTDSISLSLPKLTAAIRCYFATIRVEQLIRIPLRFLRQENPELANQLSAEIDQGAARIAKPQPQADREKIIRDDIM